MPVLQFLEDQDITYYLINPVVSYEARKTSLRKVKTDKADAFQMLLVLKKHPNIHTQADK